MKTIRHKKLKHWYSWCLFMLLSLGAKAQYVTIPDPNFELWFHQNMEHCMANPQSNQLDTVCAGQYNPNITEVNVSGWQISDLTGIQYIKNINSIDCSNNQLTSLPPISNVNYLYCNNNQLTSLPSLPSSLQLLDCSNNQLTSLPTLTNGLLDLNCSYNQLTSLPDLANVNWFNCSNNNITCFSLFRDQFLANQGAFNISNNPFTCLPNYLQIMDTTLLGFPLCANNDPHNPNNCPSFPGLVSIDNTTISSPSCGDIYVAGSVTSSSGYVSLTVDYGDSHTANLVLAGGINTPSGFNFHHNYTATGTYIITLSANTSPSGSITYTDTVVINSLPPTNSYTYSLGLNGQVQFNGTTSASNGSSNFWFVNGIGQVLNNSLNLNYTFPSNGDYRVGLFVTDSVSGCQSIYTDTITITNSVNNPSLSFRDSAVVVIQANDCLYYPGLIGRDFLLNISLGLQLVDTVNYTVYYGDGTNYTGYTFAGNSNIFIQHTYTSVGTYTGQIIAQLVHNTLGIFTDTIEFAVVVAPCGNLEGVVYNDADNDCNQGSGENGIAGIVIELKQGANTIAWAWTDSLGHYSFNVPTGNYLIQVNGLTSGYTVQCGGSLPHITNVSTSGTSIENFALHCAGFDIGVTEISLMNGFYPGVTDYVLPHVGMFNSSCNTSTVIPGQVIMTLDPKVQYVAPYWNTPTPTSVVGNVITWDIADINNVGTFGYWNYAVEITTDTTAQVGDTACITIQVLPTSGDADISNNTYTRCFEIGVAYDPNMKEAHNPGKGSQGYIPASTSELKYTIHFQNTGTAPARNIYVLDVLSNNVNLNTLKIIASSHPMQTYYDESSRTLKFMFANINLLDSTHNEPQSHGSVTYSIAPNAGLMPGTEIKNTADIYFDYNAPIVTNTTLHTIDLATGIKQVITRENSLYPNPAKNELFISNKQATQLIVRDVTGQEVMTQQLNNSSTQKVDISLLPTGAYFVTLTGSNYKETVKVIKVN